MVETNDADLSGVFFLALYATVLIPYTIYSLCYSGDQQNVVKPWVQVTFKQIALLLAAPCMLAQAGVAEVAIDGAVRAPMCLLRAFPMTASDPAQQHNRNISLLLLT